jgi:hypothetical protein
MKKVITIILISLATAAQAQKKEALPPPPVLPIDSITNLITYEEVIELKRLTADEIYKRVADWFNTYFKNPTEVIREKNEEKKTIIGKPRFKIYNLPDKQGVKTDGGLIQYTITVTAREGRFKYELTAYNWKQTSYFACEKWYDTNLSTFNTNYYEYLKQLDTTTREIVTNLKNSITIDKPIKDKDNW